MNATTDNAPLIELATLRQQSSGQTAVEWLVVAAVIFSALSLIIETTHWFLLKEHLLLHSQRATEHAAMSGGHPKQAYQYLRRHLNPRDLEIVSVCVQDEVEHIMHDFKDPVLSKKKRRALVRHNHIAAQHALNQAKGRPGGRGARSGITIAQANILNLLTQAQYPIYQPWLRPLVGRALKLRVTTAAVMQSPRELPERRCTGW